MLYVLRKTETMLNQISQKTLNLFPKVVKLGGPIGWIYFVKLSYKSYQCGLDEYKENPSLYKNEKDCVVNEVLMFAPIAGILSYFWPVCVVLDVVNFTTSDKNIKLPKEPKQN